MNPVDRDREQKRLDALADLKLLDTLPERAYDDIVQLAAYICRTPIALMTLVDSRRQWFKARHGLLQRETSRELSFCAHAIASPDQLLIVSDARADPRFAANPLVLGDPHIRFYAGAPITLATGDAIGALCVIDTVRRELDQHQRHLLSSLGRQIVQHVELRATIMRIENHVLDQHAEVRELTTSLHESNSALAAAKRDSMTDPVTGLHNRHGLQAILTTAVATAVADNLPLSVLMIDVDFFKTHNDTLGHQAGDELLHLIASVMRQSARPEDVLARYGGDEFVIVLQNTRPAAAHILADRFRRAVRSASLGSSIVTISIGLAYLTPEVADPDELLASADRALYFAKRSGRDQIACA